MALEDWQGAIAESHHLAELMPEQVLVQQSLAQTLKAQGLIEEAIRVYRRALTFAPDAFELRLGLAELLCEQEKWQEALPQAEAAIRLAPKVAQAHYYAGRAELGLEHWQPAVAHLKQAVSLEPEFFWGRYFLGQALLGLEDWQGAASVLEAAMPLNPEFHWGYFHLGRVFLRLEQYSQAVDAFLRVQTLKPDTPWLAKKLADALRGRVLMDMEAAVGWYRRAIVENPHDLENYHRALDLKSDDAQLYVQLADQLHHNNQDNGAITFYQMALRIQPDLPEVKQKLEKLLKKKIK
ncbi:MAG: tetratricopeptide repeat protein [Phormidium sp. GEM2.Bin31]|nr:MAG: tetratricopeptide repeat protein [Phormidium sp. GEM2.Bin31]